jgi:hypothetical protein
MVSRRVSFLPDKFPDRPFAPEKLASGEKAPGIGPDSGKDSSLASHGGFPPGPAVF